MDTITELTELLFDCDLFDSVAINLLESCGKINTVKNPYYSPLKDSEIIASVQKWRDKFNEQ